MTLVLLLSAFMACKNVVPNLNSDKVPTQGAGTAMFGMLFNVSSIVSFWQCDFEMSCGYKKSNDHPAVAGPAEWMDLLPSDNTPAPVNESIALNARSNLPLRP